MAPILELYGDFLFRSGGTLSAFRHLVAFALRKFPDLKVHSKICWDFITKWEALEPLVHRLPFPWPVCKAMAALALGWKWFRFALVLLMAFRGILRVGEVLRATRADLVLPSDLLSEKLDRLYLRVREPKSKRRGGGKEQHATVLDLELVIACEKAFRKLGPEALLFPYSADSHVPAEMGRSPEGSWSARRFGIDTWVHPWRCCCTCVSVRSAGA